MQTILSNPFTFRAEPYCRRLYPGGQTRAYLSSSAIGSGHQARHRPLATYHPANQLRAGVRFRGF